MRFRPWVALTVFLVILFGLVPAQSSAMPPAPEPQLTPVIVRVHDDAGAVKALVRALGGEIGVDLEFIQSFAAKVPNSALARLGQDPRVRSVSYDHPILPQSRELPEFVIGPPDTARILNNYNFTVGADMAWAEGYTGKGITVAVVDSGVQYHPDFVFSVLPGFSLLSTGFPSRIDRYGHGTHVAGIIAGDGTASFGKYVGIAPGAWVLPVRVCDDKGASSESVLVAGLQWIYRNRELYRVRVVNVSLNSSSLLSYNESPLDAALEILWFNGIVVVVSAGNSRDVVYPPGNDPFVITVGAVNENGTRDPSDDTVAPFSGYGTAPSGFSKPDLVAPGVDIVSTLASASATLYREHPSHRVGNRYFRLSGTSMAAAVTSGAAALLLEAHPELNPDEVKMRLMASTTPLSQPGAGAGILNVYNAIHSEGLGTANTGTPASQLLWTGSEPVNWGSVNWGSVNWGSVDCSSAGLQPSDLAAKLRSVNWGRMPRRSVNWGRIKNP